MNKLTISESRSLWAKACLNASRITPKNAKPPKKLETPPWINPFSRDSKSMVPKTVIDEETEDARDLHLESASLHLATGYLEFRKELGLDSCE